MKSLGFITVNLCLATILIQIVQALSQSSDEFDPFLATDIPTALFPSSDVPLQSADLDSSDFMAGLMTISVTDPPLSSSVSDMQSASIMMTSTVTISVTTLPPSGNGIITTTTSSNPTTTNKANNPTTTNNANDSPTTITNSSNCVAGSGSCFMAAPGLGAKGNRLQPHGFYIISLTIIGICQRSIFVDCY